MAVLKERLNRKNSSSFMMISISRLAPSVSVRREVQEHTMVCAPWYTRFRVTSSRGSE